MVDLSQGHQLSDLSLRQIVTKLDRSLVFFDKMAFYLNVFYSIMFGLFLSNVNGALLSQYSLMVAFVVKMYVMTLNSMFL